MGARYTVSRTSTALSTTADAITIIVPSTRAVKLWAIRLGGGAAASAYNEVLVSRSTGGVTGGGAITPSPKAPLSAASGVTVNTTWVTQPTIGVTVQRMPLNANGAINNLIFLPGMEIDVPPSGQISIRSASGTSAASVEVEFEEVG
jgi:hypothetical protein